MFRAGVCDRAARWNRTKAPVIQHHGVTSADGRLPGSLEPRGQAVPVARFAVARSGYHGAVTSVRGLNGRDTDALAVKRLGVAGRFSLAEFAARVSDMQAWLLSLKSAVVPR